MKLGMNLIWLSYKNFVDPLYSQNKVPKKNLREKERGKKERRERRKKERGKKGEGEEGEGEEGRGGSKSLLHVYIFSPQI